MTEEDVNVFRDAYRFYRKWIAVKMESPEQWLTLTEELGRFWGKYSDNKLAGRLGIALIDAIEDCWKAQNRRAVQQGSPINEKE